MDELKLPSGREYTFGDWIDSTARLQTAAYGVDPASWVDVDGCLTDRGADEFIRKGAFAAIAEIIELSEEVGWKPWASSRRVNRDAVIDEAVDVLHFIGNILRMVRCNGEELTREYRLKQRRNLERQVEGYDGVKTRCPNCHRELGDGSTGIAWYGTDDHHDPHCGACGQKLWTIEHAYVGDNLRGGPCSSCGGPRLLHSAVPRAIV